MLVIKVFRASYAINISWQISCHTCARLVNWMLWFVYSMFCSNIVHRTIFEQYDNELNASNFSVFLTGELSRAGKKQRDVSLSILFKIIGISIPIPILNPDPDPDPLLQLHQHPDQHRHHLQHDAIAGHHVALADLSLLRIQVAAGCPPNLQFSPWSGGWL